MNKNIAAYALVGIVMAVMIVSIAIFSANNQPSPLAKKETIPGEAVKEAIEEAEIFAEPGRMLPPNIFPINSEVKKNIKIQLEKQQAVDKILAEREELAIEVRKNVVAYLNAQSMSTIAGPTGESQPADGRLSAAYSPIVPARRDVDLATQKIRIEKFKRGEYRIHH